MPNLEQAAQATADKFAAAEKAITALEASVKAYQAARTTAGEPIPAVTWTKIRGRLAAAAADIADAHLAITPFDARPGAEDGGGGK